MNLPDFTTGIHIMTVSGADLKMNLTENMLLFVLMFEKFKFVNDRFGFVEGDRLLSYIGKKLQERAAKYGLVAARLSCDVFSFMDFEENIQPDALGAEIQSWVKDYPIDFEIRMTVGIYHVKTKNIPVRLMCDRASFACESIKNNYLVNVAEYNDSVKNYVFLATRTFKRK